MSVWSKSANKGIAVRLKIFPIRLIHKRRQSRRRFFYIKHGHRTKPYRIHSMDNTITNYSSTLNALISAPDPRNLNSDIEQELKKRAQHLPAKYRSTYERICKVEREALTELKLNQDAMRHQLIDAERTDNLQCMATSTDDKSAKRPITKVMNDEASQAAHQWVNGVEAGQRATLQQQFINMKMSYLDHSEKLNHRWREMSQKRKSLYQRL